MDDEMTRMSDSAAKARVLEYAWRTDRGRVRAGNEDAVAVDPARGLLIVADGIGGARAGEVASTLATEIIVECFRRDAVGCMDSRGAEALVAAAIAEANLAIWSLSQARQELSGMGTTVVVGCVGDAWIGFGYVGDSRLYRLREGRLEQLSRDHSVIQEVVDQGFFNTREDARRYGIGANILTRALGSSPKVKVSGGIADVACGDIFLFCTDGLTGMVPEDWLCQVLTASFGNDLEPAAEALVRLANERGGTDNITLALLRVGGPSTES
jgi:PPM family protein phosphatase